MLRRTITITLFIGLGAALGVAGWRTCGRHGAKCSDAGQYFPMRDADTNLFSGVVYDLSGNGIVDTFVSMGWAGITSIEVDTDEDGQIDRRLHLDTNGTSRPVAVPPSKSASD